MTDWVEPHAGFKYLSDEVTVARDHQLEKLTACGIDGGVFGDCVDPAFYIGIAIHAGIKSGISAEGNINMANTIVQHRPVRLGETLNVRGEITAVKEVPRGRSVRTEVAFIDADGRRAVTANRTSLKPDPEKVGTRGAGDKPAPLILDTSELTPRQAYQLTPAGVRAYSSEGNSIHYEPEAAVAAGFRAPIIGGGMGVHYLTAALWPEWGAGAFALDIFFRRPIFWDDAVQVASLHETDTEIYALLKPDGKVGTELCIKKAA